MRPYFRLFLRGLALGLLIGLCLGALAALIHRRIGHLPSVLPFDLFVGVLFGLVGGWCLALQTLVLRVVKDSLGVMALVVPWVGRAAAPVWLSQVNAVFNQTLGPSTGPLRALVERWIRAKLKVSGPFLAAVDREERKRNLAGIPATPSSLAYAALQVLLFPIHRVFWIAYLLLFVSAVLFWTLPILLAFSR